MADPYALYKNFAQISDVKSQSLQGGGYGLGGVSRYQHAVQSWAVAGKADDGIWYRYYFIQTDSILFTGIAGTFKINAYGADLHLVDKSGEIIPNTRLMAVTPDSTQGSTSYTTSLNETLSASGGFFGDSPTANLGYSVSVGHSVSRSIPDIAIHNRSLISDGQNASWSLTLAECALAQHDSMEFTGQMLFRVPSKPGDDSSVALKVDLTVVIEDHDNNGSGYWDRTEAVLRPHLGGIKLTKFDDRGAALSFPPLLFSLRSPRIPVG